MFLPTVLCLVLLISLSNGEGPIWKWECKEGHCLKFRATAEDKDALSLPACRLFCGEYGALWPRPTGELSLGNFLLHLNPNSVDVLPKLADSPSSELVRKAAQRFKNNIDALAPNSDYKPGGRSLMVTVDIKTPEITDLTLETDESYILKVSETSDGRVNATITADNYFGARHGLETLGQLIIYDDIRKEMQIVRDVSITDKPAYPYRGISLDTARNYFTVDSIKRTIEGMASSKLNTFHWHITDSQSFPFVSKSNPNLSKLGAYTPTKIYTPENIRDIIDYARVRGIRVLPEFDAPAHVGEGWQDTGLVACFNAQPWKDFCVEPPCGQLDPTKPELYDILEGIYGDMLELFKPDMFHMGGDEVSLSCWNHTENIVAYMTENKKWGRTESDFMRLWNVFQSQALNRLEKKAGKKLPIIMWTSTLTKAEYVETYLPKENYIIQIWTPGFDPVVKQLLDKDYRLILSNYDALYFDCGFEGWVTGGNNWCAPYIGWQKVYDNLPGHIAGPVKKKNVLGSEAALWSEQVDDTTVDSRLWPRAAAMAETLWSEPSEGWRAAENRMLIHRERLVERGISASAMQPQWCMQNQGNCPI